MNFIFNTQLKKIISSSVSTLSSIAIATSPLMSGPLAAAETLPVGGQVEAGSATISTPTDSSMIVNQSSDRAVIGWDSFSIGSGGQVNFQVPDASSATLNRVNGSMTSTIAGQMQSNGQLFLINPNGILITPTGSVRTNAFIGSSLDISNSDFLAGKNHFKGKGSSADVINQGSIVTEDGGVAVLLGGHVENTGSIEANKGAVGLASGEDITVDLTGDGLLSVTVPTSNANQTRALVSQSGRIKANGGRVELKAATTAMVPSAAINVTGAIEADSVAQTADGVSFGGGAAPAVKSKPRIRKAQPAGKAGTIVVDGGAGGTTVVASKLSATSKTGKGGEIVVTGKKVQLNAAELDASGATGGGKIEVGGSWQGKGPVANATTTQIDAASKIDASATDNGNGGEVVVWSDDYTFFEGLITAKGGENVGDGGNVEVSGKAHLGFSGLVNTLATHGKTGNLLLDPYNVTISTGTNTNQVSSPGSFTATGTGSIINISTLQTALASSNVTVSTGSSGVEAGDITVASALSWTANTTLTLDAAGSIAINAAITNSGATSGLVLNAGTGGISGSAAGILTTSGAITFNVTNASASGTYAGKISGTGSVNVAATNLGSITFSGANNFSGGFMINGGTVKLGSTTGLSNGNVALASGTIDLNGVGMNIAYLAGNAGAVVTNSSTTAATLTLGANFTGTYNGVLQDGNGKLNLVKGGGGTQILAGANTYTGTTTITSGTLNFSSNSNQTLSGAISGAGAFTKSGTGTLTLTGNNIGYTGTTTFAGGILNLGHANAIGSTGSIVFSAGTLQYSATNNTDYSARFNTGLNQYRTIDTNGRDVTFAAILQNNSSMTKIGAGTLTLSGANTYTGATTVNMGTLKAGSATAFGSGSAVTVGASGTLDLGGRSVAIGSLAGVAGGIVTNNNVSAPAAVTLTLGNTTSTSFAGIIQNGDGISLIKNGTGTQTLSGANTYTGDTAINAGGLTIGTGGTLGGGNYAGNISTTGTGTFTYASSADQVLTGSISGSISIAKTTSATSKLTLSGVNTHTGTTTITAGTLGLGSTTALGTSGSIIMNGGTLQYIVAGIPDYSSRFLATGSQSWRIDTNGQDIAFGTALAGASSTLTKSGLGTLTLFGVNTYTGATNINGGTLAITGSGSLGASGTYAGAISISSGASLLYSSSANQTLSGVVSGLGSFTKDTSASSTLTLSATNTFSGGMTISQGTVNIGNNDSLGGSGGVVSIASDATLNIASTGTTTFNHIWSGSGAINISSSNIGSGMAFAGTASSFTGTLTTSGAGKITFGTPISGIDLSSAAVAANAATNIIYIGQSVAFGSLTGSGTIRSTGTGAGTATLIVGARNDSTTFNGVLAHNTSTQLLNFEKTGTGTLTLLGENSYTGTTTINAGTLEFASNSNQALSGIISGAGNVVKSGTGTLTLSGANTYTGSTSITAGTLELASNSDQTLSGIISGGGNLTKSGVGTLTLSAANTFSGGWSINGGVLNAGSSNALGTTGNISFGGGTLQYGAGNTEDYSGRFSSAGGQDWNIDTNGQTVTFASALAGTGSSLTKSGTGTLILSAANSYTGGTAINAGTLEFASNSNQTLSGIISGAGNLNKSGTGTLSLSGANTYTGSTSISAGTLAISGSGSLGASGTYAAAISIGTGAGLSYSSSADQTLSGIISGAGNLTKFGSGTLTLSAANTFSGGWNINDGVLNAGSSNALGTTGNISFGGGTLQYGAGNTEDYSGRFSSAGGQDWNIDTNGQTVTFASALAGTGSSLTKSGTGTLILSAANSYTGGTNVEAGNLNLSGAWNVGAGTANTVVAAGADLTGTGTLTAATLNHSGLGNLSLTGDNMVDAITTSGTVGAFNFRNTKSLTVNSINGTSISIQAAGVASDLTLNTGATLTASGNNNAVILAAGRNFTNNAGSGAISLTGTETPFWRIYSKGPAGNTFADLDSHNKAVWGTNYGDTVSVGGNRYVFADTRTVTVTSIDDGKTYGNSVDLTNAYTVNGLEGVTGAFNADDVSAAFLGTVGLTSLGSDTGANVVDGGYTINIDIGGLTAQSGFTLATASTGKLTVDKRTITVTAEAKSMVYGNAAPTLTHVVGGLGLVNGDTLTGALATTANSTSDVGTYGITQGTLAASSNYALTYAANNLSVGTRAITVTADAKSMTYGNAAPTLTYVVGGDGLVNGNTLAGALATTANSTSDVGTYGITQGSLAASTNYTVTYSGNNVTVGTRAITVTADGKTMTYGNAAPTLTYFVGGDGLVNGNTLTGALATTANSTSDVGTYGITQGTLAASSNYAVTYAGANVTVGTRAITVTADGKTMTYGNAAPTLTYVVGGDGLVNGNKLTGALATTANSTSDVGTYGITQGSLAASTNYAVTYAGANVTIGTRAITVTADAKSMTYGDAAPTLTHVVGGLGLVNGDTLTGALATIASNTSDVGTYGITQGSLAASTNYALTYAANNLSVGTRAITVTADAKSMTYGNAAPTLTHVVGGLGLVNGDTLTGALATTASNTSDVGTYGITQGTLAASTNYAVTYSGANVTIGTRAITVTADAKSMTYGDAAPTLTHVVGGLGLVNGDTLTGALATTASNTSDVGTYGITQGSLATSTNYTVTYSGNNVTVGTRAITVTADGKTMTYGNAAPTLTYFVGGDGLVNGDTLIGALASAASSTSNVGDYGITQGTLAASANYTVTYSGNNVTVGTRAITVTADAKSMTYGDAAPTLTHVVGGLGLVNGDTLTGALATTASNTSDVGTYGITQGSLATSTNYAITYAGANVTVGTRAITVTADAQFMTYGDALPALSYNVTTGSLVDPTHLTGALVTTATSGSSAGIYDILRGSLDVTTNYVLTFVGSTLTINGITEPPAPAPDPAPAPAPEPTIPDPSEFAQDILLPQLTVLQTLTVNVIEIPEISVESTSCSSSGGPSAETADQNKGIAAAGQMALGGCTGGL